MTDITHPANTLISALERVQGLLRSLTTFYETPRENFVVDASFMMHAIRIAETCVDDAQSSLSDMMKHCDLTILPAVIDDAEFADEIDDEPEEPETIPHGFAEDMHDAVDVVQPAVEVVNVSTVKQKEEFAQTYLELLQKLTAAEIFAAEQQALSPGPDQQQLLPLLRSLRHDIQRLHKVA